MKRQLYILLILLCAAVAWAGESEDVRVEGSVNVGLQTKVNADNDDISLDYVTGDPRLGTNSGNHYFSNINDLSRNVQAVYGVDLDIDIHEKHTLSVSVEGKHDYERALGTREESLSAPDGSLLSRVKGEYNHANELANEIEAAMDYTCRLRRPGEALSFGYRYRWENENGGVEQVMEETCGWSLFEQNMLEQKINTHHHHAHLDYVCPIAKGHLLDVGAAYDRRELQVRTEQEWDEVMKLDADYRHLMQYGGAYARYRMKLGPVEAMARLEYRATRMQNRWLHDVLPTATVRYHIDSIHSLSAFYTIMLIRPEAHHLDTTHIADAYTERFGNDALVGVHVHNVALGYQMVLPKVRLSADLRYLTAKDGFNAIWMERAGQRIFTWGNEGVRHAVGLTPTVDAQLGATTQLHVGATVMWDERVAEAINLLNANWGVRSDMRLRQQLTSPAKQRDYAMFLVLRSNYGFHNTLDVYSHEGHGGLLGADYLVNVRGLSLSLGYNCVFKPNINITQGAYVGTIVYRPGATHMININLSYHF